MPHTLRTRSALVWLIVVYLGMTGCGASPAAQPAQLAPPPATVSPTAPRRTVVPPRLTPSSAPASATVETSPADTATITPAIEATPPTDATTIAPAIEATPIQAVSLVTNGGNLRTEPRIAPQTVIGQVCPGDQITLLESRQVGATLWYRVRLNQLAQDCDPNRVALDAEGWLSSLLASAPSAPIALAASTTALPDTDATPTLATAIPTSVLPSNAPFNIPGVQGKIVFVGEHADGWDIYTSHLDGTGLLRLTTHGMALFASPVWSPDGERIAFAKNHTGKNDIYVMNIDGSGLTRLTDDPASDYAPAWSPDGTRIAFQSNRNGNSDMDNNIYVMNADGSEVIQLTKDPSSDTAPAWSPDGTHIAFVSNREYRNVDLYVMRADGSQTIRLTKQLWDDMSPAWAR